MIAAGPLRDLKTELMGRGVTLSPAVDATGPLPVRVRKGGAGPAQGVTLMILGEPLSVPVVEGADAEHAYTLAVGEGEGFLTGPGLPGLTVGIVPSDPFAGRTTSDGVEFGRVALMHGADCLASTVIQSCIYWGADDGCRFCAIGVSLQKGLTLARKSPRQLAEVAVAAAESGLAAHVVLTTGCTGARVDEIGHLAECARAVKEASGLRVSAQCRPPDDPAAFVILREAGVDTVGVHIESLDPRTLAWVAPAKAAIGWTGYTRAWRRAVEVFGRGQVTTYVIIGLGERLDLTVRRLARVAEMGVYPHVVPFRPIPGSRLAHHPRPRPETMRLVYEAAARAVEEAGLAAGRIKAGCGRCTACSVMAEWEAGREWEVGP